MRGLSFLILLFSWTAVASQVELLRCVQELGEIRATDQDGLEFQAGLAVGAGSLRTSVGIIQVLFLANERGVYTFPLRAGQINRLQVEIPNADPRLLPRRLFITYLHSQIYGSRLQTIDWEAPPMGTTLSQFILTPPLAMLEARNQLVRLVQNQLQALGQLYRQGKLARADLLQGNLSLCRRLATDDRRLAHALQQQVQELEMVSTNYRGGSRFPASAP